MAAAQISIPLPRGEARLPEASSPEAPSPEAPPPEVPLSDMPGTTIPLPGAPPSAPQSTIVQTPMGAHGRPDINPYDRDIDMTRSEEHTSELQSLMRNSYAVFCLKKKKHT